MYNDETIIESMTDIGYSLEDARNYVAYWLCRAYRARQNSGFH